MRLDIQYYHQIRLMFLLNDLLDLAKLEAGKMTYTMNDQDICVCIASIANEFQPILEEKSLQLKTDYQKTPLTTVYDTNRISQVLRNLLSNSIKFSKAESEIVIHVKKEVVTIQGKQQVVIMVLVELIHKPFYNHHVYQ